MNGWMVFLLTFRFILWSINISKMGKDNLIYVSMINFGVLTTYQPGQVHIGYTESITYTHDELIHIRENCKDDNRCKILGYDTCKNVRRLRLNRNSKGIKAPI